jgi:HSP20 family protein
LAIHRWDPLTDLLSLQDRMNRVFEHTFARERLDDPELASGSWVPLADVYETTETFVVEVELPGLGQEDIEVQVDGDQLTVRGERRLAGPSRPQSFHRIERSYGGFSRSFRFHEEVDPDRVTARFEDGLLRLEVPKARPRGSSRIRVERPE